MNAFSVLKPENTDTDRELCRVALGPLSPFAIFYVRTEFWVPTCPVRLRVYLLSSLDSYLVDPASSHMLVSKIKPCMSKYKPH